MVPLSVLLVLSAVFVLMLLEPSPSLAKSTGLASFSPNFAEFLGMLTPMVAPAAQLVVTAVFLLAARQPAVPTATAVGRGWRLELLYPTEQDSPRLVETLVALSAQQGQTLVVQVRLVVG